MRITSALFALLLFTSAAQAQLKQGSTELTLSGSGSADNSLDSTTLAGNVGLGYMLTNNLELTLSQSLAYASVDDADQFTGETRVGALLNVTFGKLQFGVGPQIGVAYGEGTDYVAGPQCVARYWITESVGVFGAVSYDARFDNFSDLNEAFDDGVFVLKAGLTWAW